MLEATIVSLISNEDTDSAEFYQRSEKLKYKTKENFSEALKETSI